MILFADAAVAEGGEGDGPSAEQIARVEERRASFPVARLVESIDWYQPLVNVPGRPSSFPRRRVLVANLEPELRAFASETDSFALLVAREGRLIHEYYAPGFTRTSRFDTASMHKAIVSLLIGAAIADGAINSVDDPLSRYLPNLPDDGRGSITLRQLLEMRSGLQTPPVSESAASPYWQTYFGNNLDWSIARWPMHPETRDTFYYANANTQYLLWVLQRSTGQQYVDYLSRRLWQPIGAQDARLWLDREGGSPRGFCCLQASARDWLRIGELIRNQGKWRGESLIPAEWVEAMLAPSIANPNFGRNIWRGSPYAPTRTYGPGVPAVVRSAEPFQRDDTVFIDGSGGQRVYVIPSEGLTIVRIGRPQQDWDDSRLPNLVVGLVQ
ncbi:serine hydrolase [Sphingomonas lacunae]|uniref:Serine hydrolase n=1 Tax=Sphingomonas lacunae TaxID=2698828 RepID=A0A6M4AZI0_9SPHN|nr:serine hydrolase [Sphingomonas lacunae]QJQ32441.1 serine hydrolase [Sphingomonas lacunae]